MAYRWPPKDPDEILDYSIDWSRFLATATITTVTWYINNESNVKTLFSSGATVNGIQNVAQTNTNTVATIHLGLGTLNKEYLLYCSVQDSAGNTVERSVRLKIKEQ
jgi:hypothetical protein